MREIELKLLLTEEAEKRLRRKLAEESGEASEIKAISLHAIYLDTVDRALAAHGLALRLRKEGRRWVQTVKMGSGLSGGLSTPLESNNPAPGGKLCIGAIPDVALRERVLDAADPADLAPVFETDIRRTLRLMHTPDGGVVEVALDVGEIRAGARAVTIREAELELKSGEPPALYALAKALFEEGPVRFSRRTKAARGHALAEGRSALSQTPEPVMAKAVALTPEMTAETAAAAVLRCCLDQISGNLAAAALNDAPEGPHQLRVGLRRLRTAATVFAPVLGGEALDAIAAQAQALASAVGGVRDLDVLTDERIGPMAAADPRLAPLAEALSERRDAARVAARGTLASREASALLFDLGAFVEGRGWLRRSDFGQTAALAQPVTQLAAAALDKRWRKAAALGERIETLEGEARHDLRKALKKLRYATEFFASLYPAKRIKPFVTRLKALQDDFGALQDLAMAEEVLFAEDAPGAASPAAQRAAGLALGRWEGKADADWRSAQAHWAALAAQRRFWR
ncbi:CYTH and CHAD domain-containing protein [Rubrimonas cliftonensis]|uniref:Inorganic triphosphatase YgiF, contains CYTH and CHAD domains n=1 Tax=Rubrimonas cliftonensis TaxID=89524 RepID=A0A1H3VQ99_9RHOB|nr:CYTH and CHAD domain-containing protein [Rubrimonas cliftonensis]SDZ76995.1 Inorganic triphosphatase YgiF, contains CYTH and CHAD domains [Rubrimonas cliftonensis]